MGGILQDDVRVDENKSLVQMVRMGVEYVDEPEGRYQRKSCGEGLDRHVASRIHHILDAVCSCLAEGPALAKDLMMDA